MASILIYSSIIGEQKELNHCTFKYFPEKATSSRYIMSPVGCNITTTTDETDLKVKNLQLKRKAK